jgi:hypothetical protein
MMLLVQVIECNQKRRPIFWNADVSQLVTDMLEFYETLWFMCYKRRLLDLLKPLNLSPQPHILLPQNAY